MRQYCPFGTRAVSNWYRLALTVPGMSREMLALFPSVKGLYSQATTPEVRKPPDGLWTCPNSSTVPVRVTLTADTALTSTVCSTVTKVGAEARNSKEADHSERFTTPVVPVVPCATS